LWVPAAFKWQEQSVFLGQKFFHNGLLQKNIKKLCLKFTQKGFWGKF